MSSLFFALFFSLAADAAEPCAPRSCAEFKYQSVCLAGPGAPDDIKEASLQKKLCGDSIVKIASKDDLGKAIKKLSDDCVKIDRLFVSSEGLPGMAALDPKNPMMIHNVADQLGGFRCLTQKGTTVQFLGSLVGAGCRGEDFSREVAKSVLPEGGRVNARMGYREPVSRDYWDTMNNRNLTLNYDPKGNPPESWENKSTTDTTKTTQELSSRRCAEEIARARKDYEKLRDLAKIDSCDVSDQSALLEKSKKMESDFANKKIPDQRYGSDYKPWDYFGVVGNLDRAAYEVAQSCAHEGKSAATKETGSQGKQ